MAKEVTASSDIVSFKGINISKKMSVLFVYLVLLYLQAFGILIPEEAMKLTTTVVMTYLTGQSLVDMVLAYKGIKK